MIRPVVTGRPIMPDGYGVTPEGPYMAWDTVRERLERSLHYWMATTLPEGTPHVVPRWGVWLDEQLWYDGSPATRHARNVLINQATALHLESGSGATIAYGVSATPEPLSPLMGQRVSRSIAAKYGELGYAPEADAWSDSDAGGMLVFTPAIVIAWTEFASDATRFSFG